MALLIARRDASFYNRPDTDTVKRYHAVKDENREVSACGVMLDVQFTATAYDSSLPLCRRAACQREFQKEHQ